MTALRRPGSGCDWHWVGLGTANWRPSAGPRYAQLDESNWRSDQIVCSGLDRGSALQGAGLLDFDRGTRKRVRAEQALGIGEVRWRLGREHSRSQWDDCRAAFQFRVGAQIFDWFFNARTGYRAHFRVRYEFGETLRPRLDASLPLCVPGREFENCGKAQIPKSFVIASCAGPVKGMVLYQAHPAQWRD